MIKSLTGICPLFLGIECFRLDFKSFRRGPNVGKDH